MEELIIRRANEKDRKQIANVISICYEKEFSTLAKDMSKIASALSSGIQILRFHVAEINGKIIGISACSDCNGRAVCVDKKSFKNSLGIVRGLIATFLLTKEFEHSLPYSADTGYVEFVGVLPEYQGRSVAKKMIKFFIKTLRYQQFILDVTDINIPAQRCYEHIGFVEYQRISEHWGKIKGFRERIFMKYEES